MEVSRLGVELVLGTPTTGSGDDIFICEIFASSIFFGLCGFTRSRGLGIV